MEIEIGGKKIEFEIKNLAERANGEAMVRSGDTQILATCVISEKEIRGLGFFPLTVNYEEKYYAAGKILGPRYVRREGRPSDNAIIVSRTIDRAIRPFFDEGLKAEVQVIVTCLSWDGENDPDILGLLGASFALMISDIPWQGPIGAVRIGEKDGKLILNPTYKEREESCLDIIMVGKKENGEILLNMVEGSAKEVKEDLILKAWEIAKPEIEKEINFQEKIAQEIGKKKFLIEKEKEPELEKEIKEVLGKKIEEILFGKDGRQTERESFERAQKLNQLKEEIMTEIEEKYPGKGVFAKEIFENEVKELVHQKAIKEERRVDGRKLDEIRKLDCQVGCVPRAHGSGFFSRGMTKSLSILTLGGPGEQQVIEGMEIVGKKRFLHHYNFPPYSVGEVKSLTAPSRREISHGMLAEKALFPLIPDFDDFPYTIRIVSEILSSNGSTSMASISSSSLALMDAGVPIKRPAAGIAIGLMKKGKDYRVLTDIQGPEDFHGDMDFKIAGTREGITALQMDVKILGINEEILKEALLKAKEARLKILDSMEKVLEKPRENLSPFAPKIYKLEIPIEKIGEVIGPKGYTIKKIIEQTGVSVEIDPSGTAYITSVDEDSAKKALGFIKNIAREIKVGESFLGTVKRILSFGVILELEPGREGLLPISKLKRRVRRGQKIPVKVESIDELGRINLVPKKYGRKGN